MISQIVWRKQLSKCDPVYSLCVNPINFEIITACSNDVIFINPESGEITDRKRFHRSAIYSIRMSFDGIYFASSSSDGMVIIWQTKDHDSIVNFGSTSAVHSLFWSPTQEDVLALSIHEYHIWQSSQARSRCIQIKDHSSSLENGSFSTDGSRYALSFSDFTVKIYELDSQNEIQSLSFLSPLTIIKFRQIDKEDYFITVDIDRYVSITRISDKTLIRKNELPFEALQMIDFQIEKSNYFLFAGVSNKVSIYTDDLMFLDNIQCKEKWIWDIYIGKNKNILLCGRSGFIEMRTFCFSSCATSISNFIAYIDNLNSFQLINLLDDQSSFTLQFPQIIHSLAISYHHLLVMFKTNICVYLINFQDKIETNDDLYRKMFEIPGNFDGAKSDISDRNIFVSCGKILTVYSMNGILKANFNFHSEILSVIKTEAVSDGCVVGCKNGSIFFYIVDQPEPSLLFKHKKAVKFAKKWNLTLAFIDEENELFVINYFTSEVIFSEKNILSFEFSDRVENLFAYSDCNSNLYIRFLHHKSDPSFIEGKIIAFFGNDVILLNGNAIVHCVPELPFEKILRESKLPENDIDKDNILLDFYELVSIGPTTEQWELIYDVSSELNIVNVVQLAAQHIGKNYFDIQYSQKVDYGQIEIEKNKMPDELEKMGLYDLAIRKYANLGDRNNVYRLINSFKLEDMLLELCIPESEIDNAAKYLLNSKKYDSAILLLKKSKNVVSLAKLYVSVGRWIDAVTLAHSNPSIYHIVFPKFAEQLFEHKNYFESLICFFIPTILFDAENRASIFSKLYNNAILIKDSYIQMSFVCLLQAFNDPFNYWILHQKSVAFYASNRLSQFLMLPMTRDDAKIIFLLCYYIIAVLHRFQMRGVHYVDILIQFHLSSAILGFKKWFNYSLEEISSFSITDSCAQIVKMAEKIYKENEHPSKSSQKVEFLCSKCQKDIFQSSSSPLLQCGSCGSPIAFSAHSCTPLPLTDTHFFKENSEKVADTQKVLSYNEGQKIDPHVIVQSLKSTARVRPRIWLNERIEEVHCCRNCGAMYGEADYEDAVAEERRCAICHSASFGEETDAEESAILNLLKFLEEDSPVSF